MTGNAFETVPIASPVVRVLIADDSTVVCQVLKHLLESDPLVHVVGTATTGAAAVRLTASLKPDLVTMDLVMPEMDGMEATRRIMAQHPTPVLFLSAFLGKDGHCSRAEAIAAGALDVMEKPALAAGTPWGETGDAFIRHVKSLARVPVVAHMYGARESTARRKQPPRGPAVDVVGIGASSGGPRVLEELLSVLPATYGPGIVVVQHIAGGFTTKLLHSLRQRCALSMKVAEEGDVVRSGSILIAPESHHLVVERGGRVRLSDGNPVNGHRPSVDVAFESIARAYGVRAAGFLLTGMGSDGAAGLLGIRRAGGITCVQNEDTCTIFGMPRAAIEMGAAQNVLSPEGLAARLRALDREGLGGRTESGD